MRSPSPSPSAGVARRLAVPCAVSLIACAHVPATAPPKAHEGRPSAPPCESVTRGGTRRRVSKEALERLAAAARETDTGALIVVERGEVVLEVGDVGRRFELMSVTKSVVSLVIGQLIDRKLLRLDSPVADFIPAWKGTPKEQIQIAHILAHTSGLDDKRTTEDIYASGDFVQFAATAEVKAPPGERFFYSNRAANLLAAVVSGATGERLDEWARSKLFRPSGISDFRWSRDPAGNVQVMAGLQMSALDLARLGQLVLDGGVSCGNRVVSEEWLRRSTGTYEMTGFAPHGLYWWLDPESRSSGFTAKLFANWKSSGVPEEFIAKLRPLEGQFFDKKGFFRAVDKALSGQDREVTDANLEPYYQMTWKANRPDAEVKYGPVRAVVADGWGGQALIVYPKESVVVVRLRDVKGPDDAKGQKSFVSVTNKILWNLNDGMRQ